MYRLILLGLSLLFLQGLQGAEKFYSDGGQDKWLYDNIFKDKKGGVFVEIGAYDGLTQSNTLFFERHLGWKGICIEPIPEAFQKLQKNRKCTCIEGAIYDKSHEALFLHVKGTGEMLSGVLATFDPRQLQRIFTDMSKLGIDTEILIVKCFALTSLLLNNNYKHVDYLSIDCEGGEMEVLKSIDYDAVDISVISVERNFYDISYVDFMKSKGYELIVWRGNDEIYRKVKK